jgi:hypothetical protein
MRNADLAPEGRAGDADARHRPARDDLRGGTAMWENPTIQRELANLIITERVRRASRRHRTGR